MVSSVYIIDIFKVIPAFNVRPLRHDVPAKTSEFVYKSVKKKKCCFSKDTYEANKTWNEDKT